MKREKTLIEKKECQRFGRKIKHYRTKNNLSQDELAELIGLTRQAISEFENGKNRPSFKTIIKLEKVFNKPGCLRNKRIQFLSPEIMISIESLICLIIMILIYFFYQ